MNRIYTHWCSLKRSDGKENYGDFLAPYIVNKISGKKVVNVVHPMMRRYRFFFKIYVTVGSIIRTSSEKSIVWGSGIILKNENIRKATFLAVRGPRTRNRLIELGYEVPEIYGDPALLLPKFIANNVIKKYKLGIIPHYVDYLEIQKKFGNDNRIKIINLVTNDVEKTTREILECETTISSSLHGVIVSHAYSIPSLWIKFSEKLTGDNVKFYDYFESIGITYVNEIAVNSQEISIEALYDLLDNKKNILLPSIEVIEKIKHNLILTCPFKSK
jgi:pyruvyltransferase